MFGPDKCGSTNKVHFIFRHRNPLTGEWEEKHLNNPPQPKITKTTALYTLIVNPDQTFEILINDEVAREGSLLEDFTPAVNPPKEIDDPEDFKPESWVDEAEIDDTSAVKVGVSLAHIYLRLHGVFLVGRYTAPWRTKAPNLCRASEI